MLKTAVVTSKIKNSFDAGQELGQKILKKLNRKPELVLLFSTQHYIEYKGGLEDVLKDIKSVLPKKTQLAGGTTNGFINNDGCHARGVTALAISYPNINISIGYGKNTKRNPKKAAKKAFEMIKSDLKNEYKNKFVFSFISGVKNPNLPGVKMSNIVDSKIKAKIMLSMFSFMQKVFQLGFGREEEVLQTFLKKLPNYNLITYSPFTVPPEYNESYLFCNDKIFNDGAIFVVIDTDLDFSLDFVTGAEKTNINLEITQMNKSRTVIKKLNNKPPLEEYINKMGWNYQTFENFKWTDIASKNPFGYKKNDRIILRPSLLILGEYMGFPSRIEKNNVSIYKITPDEMVNSIDQLSKPTNPEFGFFTSCIVRRDFLGIKVFRIQEKLKNYFKDKDFLVVYSSGEAINKPDEDFYFLAETITSAIFY